MNFPLAFPILYSAVFIITKRQSKVHCNLTYCWQNKNFHLQFTHKFNVIQNKLQTSVFFCVYLCLFILLLFFFGLHWKLFLLLFEKSNSKQQRQRYFLWKYFYYFFMFFFSFCLFRSFLLWNSMKRNLKWKIKKKSWRGMTSFIIRLRHLTERKIRWNQFVVGGWL